MSRLINSTDITTAAGTLEKTAIKRARYNGLSVVSSAKQSLNGGASAGITAGVYETARIRHVNLTGKPVSHLALVYACYGPASGTEANNPNQIVVQGSITDRSTTGGATDATQDQPKQPVVSLNGTVMTFSPLNLDRRAVTRTELQPHPVEANGVFFTHTGVSVLTTADKFPRGGCAYGGTSAWGVSNGEGVAASLRVDDALTISESFNNAYYSESAVLGRTFDGSITASLFITGDSIETGGDDCGFGGANVGGLAKRAFAAWPQVYAPCPGEKLGDIAGPQGFTKAFYARGKLAALTTHVYLSHGRNDVEQAVPLATFKANLLAAAKVLMARGQHVLVTTTLPAPLSTDGWFTTTNQTIQDVTKEATRVAQNSWLRDTTSTGFVAQANAQVVLYVYPGQAVVLDRCAPVECNTAGVLTQDAGLLLAAQSAVTVSGTATSGSTTTLVDTSKTMTPNQYAGWAVRIVSGTGAGQMRGIAYHTATTFTTNIVFTTPPDATSVYEVYKATFGNGVHPFAALHDLIANNAAIQAKCAAFMALD